jgi:hypothetical protein
VPSSQRLERVSLLGRHLLQAAVSVEMQHGPVPLSKLKVGSVRFCGVVAWTAVSEQIHGVVAWTAVSEQLHGVVAWTAESEQAQGWVCRHGSYPCAEVSKGPAEWFGGLTLTSAVKTISQYCVSYVHRTVIVDTVHYRVMSLFKIHTHVHDLFYQP